VNAAVRIVEAESDAEFRAAARLMREFLSWVRERYADSPQMVDAYFGASKWEKDLAALDAEYTAPNGVILLAFHEDKLAGCVAMRKIESHICEMKRLYVRGEFQQFGIGRRLCKQLLQYAKDRGFRDMRLETGDQQHEAQTLYRSLGFRKIEPYYQHPPVLQPRVIFMEARIA
jgi:putative acetyltransferase